MKYDLQTHGLGWRGYLANHILVRDQTYQFQKNKNVFRNGAVYQFGVWNGFSLQVLSHLFNEISRISNTEYNVRYYGFDVFTGMPVEENEPQNQIDDPGWYNILEHFNTPSLDHALFNLEGDIRSNMGHKSKLTFIPGLVQETLTDDLAKTLIPASYVDMDMDIYSPTKFALDFLFKHKLIIEGTIIGYDDWGQKYPEIDTYNAGESRAHKEVFEKYGVEGIELFNNLDPRYQDCGQSAFLVTKIKYT